jgi:hypothetical protein
MTITDLVIRYFVIKGQISCSETQRSNVHKNERHEIEWLPPYEYRRGWSSWGDLVVSFGGLLGVAVLDPDNLPCLDY